MAENPYDSGSEETAHAPKTCATRWMIWLGVGLIALGVAGVYTAIRAAVHQVAGGTLQPKPSDVADGVLLVQLAHLAVLPLFVLGGVLVIAGFLVRKPAKEIAQR